MSKKLPQKVIDENGTVRWYKDGQLHREDGPAVEYESGSKYWYQNGHHHREDGPATVRWNGCEEWYLNGQKVDEHLVEIYRIFKMDISDKERLERVEKILNENYNPNH